MNPNELIKFGMKYRVDVTFTHISNRENVSVKYPIVLSRPGRKWYALNIGHAKRLIKDIHREETKTRDLRMIHN